MEKNILSVRKIRKEFPGVVALNNVDFELNRGEVHAVCGENGAGKSTLMHILAGMYKPDGGEIYINGNKVEIINQRHANEMKISIVYQERSLVGQLTVMENIFSGRQPLGGFLHTIDYKKMELETKRLLDGLQIYIHPKDLVKDLSAAMQQMVEIAKSLSLRPEILILDEPTATITEKEVDALFKMISRLRIEGIAIIYISHRIEEIFRIADRVTVLKDGCLVDTAQVKDIDKNWVISKMIGRELLFNRVERKASNETILEVKNLTGNGFSNVSFTLKKGEILSFAGLAGAGRTEVMRAVFGADTYKKGEVFLEGKKLKIKDCYHAIKNGIAYLTEDRKELGIFSQMTLAENIVSARLDHFKKGYMLDTKKIKKAAEEYKDRLRIITPSILQKVVNLSGGNQQKVCLARLLIIQSKILLIDEPTRGIDVGAKAEIYSLLRQISEGGMSIIVVSSELPEVLSISDRIYVMHNGIIRGELNGSEATEEHVVKYASGLM